MKSFDEIWEFSDTIPGSFTRLSGEKLYEYAMQVPRDGTGTIVEIGVDQGRSASVLLATIEETNAYLFLIDSWESVLIDNKLKVERLLRRFSRPDNYKIILARSTPPPKWFQFGVNLLHIDANHYPGGVDEDCKAWLPKLVSGGVVCFHDYGASFPCVTESVDKYTAAEDGWEQLGEWDGLAIRRKA